MRLCRKKPPPGQRRCAVLLGSLLLAAAAALRAATRPCPDAHAAAAAHPRCRERLYRALELSPGRRSNCSGVVRGGREAIQEAQLSNLEVANKRAALMPSDFLNMTKDCGSFKEARRFIEFPLSQEEAEFPIAYSMVIHDKIEMFERLLRSLYTPQNVYCVHVDGKSPAAFQEAVRAIVACFPNVFVASRLEKVVYASWSRLQADLNCMQDLLQSPVPWRYILNTCGTDFPIKTNAEIVRALKMLQGRNSMESEKPSALKQERWQYHHEGEFHLPTATQKLPPPHNSPMFTGNAYIVVTRAFVQHIFENPTAQKFLEWAKDTYSPDEHVWATLNRMPGVPGAMPQKWTSYQLSDMNALPRLQWQYLEGDTSKGAPYPPPCTGQHQRAVCIYGAGDVPWMLQQHPLANKFDPWWNDAAIQCLEEHLRHRALYGRGL
ncbi:LOW QUALITY PROTEIN: beta-1,3-galactosyl-O-glycosyl-glycoprotein beta-1,6-N-acetylglucosaminyltransferase 3 [Ciconia maguari]